MSFPPFKQLPKFDGLIDRWQLLDGPVKIWACAYSPDRLHVPTSADAVHYAYGVGFSNDEAALKATAESIERITATRLLDAPVTKASWNMVKDHAIYPNDVMSVADWQFNPMNVSPSELFTVPLPLPNDESIDWVEVKAFQPKLAPRLMAAGLLYSQSNSPYIEFTTNGLGAHYSIRAAVRHACLELIERDSVALWWYNQLKLPRLEHLFDFYETVNLFKDMFKRHDRIVWLLNLTSDLGVPVVGAISSYKNGDGLLFGFGSGSNIQSAATHALKEVSLALGLYFIAEKPQTNCVEDYGEFLYGVETDHLTKHMARKSTSSNAGFRPLLLQGYWFNYPSTIATDWRIVRAIIPGMGQFLPRFGAQRLADAPARLGFSTVPENYKSIPAPPFL